MEPKPLVWTGSSWKDFQEFPAEVQSDCGYALHLAQTGKISAEAKALRGIDGGGAAVMEIVLDHHRETYRAVYTTKLKGVVYVLHCFQKKSKRGIATPQQDIALIKARLISARKQHQAKSGE
jgi:phage-related protein